ncbi:MAG: class I SAM-dependent methyltransferase [Candidatus Promineifilaceae bacterium]
MESTDSQRTFEERYVRGEVPWDAYLPPPEVMALADRLEAGRALDLGSGYGRSSIYLALEAWSVDGVEFIPIAVDEARRRARQAGVTTRAHFYVGDVTRLDFLSGPYDLALDVGCMHSFSLPALEAYHASLKRLLPQGACYLLFAHLRDREDGSEESMRWVDESSIRTLFADGFYLEEIVYGVTKVPNHPPWSSAWLTFQRI